MDNSATSKIALGVLKEINEFSSLYANASSQHEFGRLVREKIEKAREKIAKTIGAESEEIIFTSGGSEGDNFAIKGLALANPEKKHIVTTIIEHPAVLETCKALEKQGYFVDYVKVNSKGIVEVSDIEKKIRDDTLVVSVMHVNNEIGTIQPIKEIGEVCKKKKVYFHSDCVQSFLKVPINVSEMNIDILTVSGHKVHSLKGIGFNYVKLGTRIRPLIDGGGQEFKLRGGTENSLGIIALARATEINFKKEEVRKIRDFLEEELMKMKGVKINGDKEKRVYNILNVSFYGIEGEGLMLRLEGEEIYVSTGSACASHKLEESYVLDAIKVDELYIHGSLRISLSNENTIEEARKVVLMIKKHVNALREMSPFKLNEEDASYASTSTNAKAPQENLGREGNEENE